ncbi:TDT family transporter [Pseudoalteromonas piscicida]|nr:TDT family transporter [Pseudoalteromonas piscicida]
MVFTLTYLTRFATTVPTPMSGLALGLASMGWCLSILFPSLTYTKPLGALIAAVILLLLILKFIQQPTLLKADLSHPVVGSVLPTSAMTLMVIAHNVADYSCNLATIIWLLAIGLHFLLLTSFIYFRSRDFSLDHIVPSWFIPPVGFVVADVTFKGIPALQPLAIGLWYLGVSCYLLLLPIMIYRLCFGAPLSTQTQPTIAVMAAPASLCLAGYLSITSLPNSVLVLGLLTIAVMMTIFVYLAFIQLLRLPFSPAFSAYTFPLVIGVTALNKVKNWSGFSEFSSGWHTLLHGLFWIELGIASFIVTLVCIHYVKFFIKINAVDSEH